MKVALFVHCYFPGHFHGTESYTAAVARQLRALGHHPVVVTATPQGEAGQEELVVRSSWEGTEVIRIDRNRLPQRTLRHTYEFPALTPLLTNILSEVKPDVVHICHLANHTTALVEAARTLGLPVVATLTDYFGFCLTNKLEAAGGGLCPGPSGLRDNCLNCYLKPTVEDRRCWATRILALDYLRFGLAKFIAVGSRASAGRMILGRFRPSDITMRPDVLRKAAHAYAIAIAPTLTLKTLYEKQGFPCAIRLGRIGVDVDRTMPPPRPGATIRLGFVGQIAPHKGLDVLLAAMRRSGESGIEALIWGSIAENNYFSQKIKSMAHGLKVEFRGIFKRERVSEVLAEIDVLIVPSVWVENGPLIMLQALAAHRPVIASDVLGLTEFIRNDVNGLIFKAGDPDALAAVLRRIACNPEEITRMGLNAEYRLTERDMVDEILYIYSEACRGNLPNAARLAISKKAK